MAAATNTTFGEIKLAGDLAGSNNASSPQLSASGVTPGAYSFPTITVDGKGRITSAVSATPSELAAKLPNATSSQKGLVKLGTNIGYNVSATAGYQAFTFGGTITGTDNALIAAGPNLTCTVTTLTGSVAVSITAGVRTFNSVIASINGSISSINAQVAISGNQLILSSTAAGAGSYATVSSDNLFKYLQGYVSTGIVNYGSAESSIYIADASVSTKGLIKPGQGLSVTSGTLNFDITSIPTATNTTAGMVKTGTTITNNGGIIDVDQAQINLNMPIASASVLGGMKVGSGLSIDGSGVLSVNAFPTATTSVLGTVKPDGTTILVSSGTISVPSATYNTPGVVEAGYGLQITNGVLSADPLLATNTTAGIVKIGSGLSVTNGVVSFDPANLPVASASTKGVCQIGEGLSVTGGVVSFNVANSAIWGTTSQKGILQVSTGGGLSVASGVISYDAAQLPVASSTVFGVAKTGTGLTSTGGVISIDAANLPLATTGTRGAIKVGSNLVVDGAGTLNVPTATSSVKGVCSIGTSLSVASGVVSATVVATASVAGLVKAGSGLTAAADGTLSFDAAASMPVASSTVLGLVKTGVGITNTSGTISIPSLPIATTTTRGVCQIGYGLSVSAGVVSVAGTFAFQNLPNLWSSVNRITQTSLTDSSSVITPNLDSLTSGNYILTKNISFAAPTGGPASGEVQSFTIHLVQDATGGRTVTFNSAYKFKDGVNTVQSTAGGITIIRAFKIGGDSNIYCALEKYA